MFSYIYNDRINKRNKMSIFLKSFANMTAFPIQL